MAREAKSAAAAPLDSESIAALGHEFRTATDPLRKRELFAKLLAGLTAENALEIREQIAGLESNDPAFRDFHFAWGKVAGRDAVLHGVETDKLDMGPALAGWAAASPADAKAWFESLENKGGRGMNREQLKESFVNGLAIANPDIAADFVMGLGRAGDPRSKQLMSMVAEKVIQSAGTAAATTWAAALPETELRARALHDVARARVREDPAAASAWAATQTGDRNAGTIVYAVASEWSSRDGAAAVRWLNTLSGNQSEAYGPALAGWARADPLAASKHVAAMPPSGDRDYAIGGLVYSHRWEDPAAAVTWANAITDAKRREQALTLAAEAYARKDPAGAAAWLPSSGLPEETQRRLQGGGK
jgi:hypothetical protein